MARDGQKGTYGGLKLLLSARDGLLGKLVKNRGAAKFKRFSGCS